MDSPHVEFKEDSNTLYIYLYVTDELIRDADDIETVAKLAAEEASKAAYKAVMERRAEHEEEK